MRGIGVLLLSLAAACGEGSIQGGSGPDGTTDLQGLMQITVSPPSAQVVIDNGRTAQVTYTAEGTFSDGHKEDITSRVTFRVNKPDLGKFAGNVFTTGTTRGGLARVDVVSGFQTGTAQLIVKLKQSYADPGAAGLPGNAAGLFGGPAAAARNPTLVYPADGVLVPPNLAKLELHFLKGGDANTVFELSLQSMTLDLRIYTACTQPAGAGCIYLPDAKVWTWLAQSNRGGDVTATVRATDSRGSGVGASPATKISFSEDDLEGALYYWTTPAGESDGNKAAIYRWDFASTTQTEPEVVVTPEMTGGHCVGCHALSPDGKKLFVTSEGSYDAYVLLYDVAAKSPIVPFASTDRVAWASWEWPDGERFVGTFADNSEARFRSFDLNLYDGRGAFLQTIPVGGSEGSPSAHPDWSPDGTMIAFTRVGVAGNSESGTTRNGARASLRMVTKSGNGWSQPIALTAAQEGKGTYYPTFSPDSRLLLFNQSVCADGKDGEDCNMDVDASASLWIMRPLKDAQPVHLARADRKGYGDGASIESSFPKWTPLTFRRTEEFGKRLFWFTFSSNRGYGLRAPDAGETLIWMAGVDPDVCLNGEDGSFPAFALPFQDVHRDNHTAQWAKRGGILIE